MRKNYISPISIIMEIKARKVICASRGVSSDRGIDYGGADENGDIVPESRTWKWGDF